MHATVPLDFGKSIVFSVSSRHFRFGGNKELLGFGVDILGLGLCPSVAAPSGIQSHRIWDKAPEIDKLFLS